MLRVGHILHVMCVCFFLRCPCSTRAACNEARRAARIMPCRALPDRNAPSVDNGKYSTYSNSPYPVCVYCTCCAKNSKAKSTIEPADPTHCGTGGFCRPILAACHQHLSFPNLHKEKTGTAYHSLLYLENLWLRPCATHHKNRFLVRPRRGSLIFHCPLVATN